MPAIFRKRLVGYKFVVNMNLPRFFAVRLFADRDKFDELQAHFARKLFASAVAFESGYVLFGARFYAVCFGKPLFQLGALSFRSLFFMLILFAQAFAHGFGQSAEYLFFKGGSYQFVQFRQPVFQRAKLLFIGQPVSLPAFCPLAQKVFFGFVFIDFHTAEHGADILQYDAFDLPFGNKVRSAVPFAEIDVGAAEIAVAGIFSLSCALVFELFAAVGAYKQSRKRVYPVFLIRPPARNGIADRLYPFPRFAVDNRPMRVLLYNMLVFGNA